MVNCLHFFRAEKFKLVIASNKKVHDFTIKIAQGKTDLEEIAQWLKDMT